MRTKRKGPASTNDDQKRQLTGVDTGEVPVVSLQHGSFENFYRGNRQHIFRALALTLGDRDLAEDAV
ncbi:MAG: hypothetical protein ACRD1T_07860, partial [Acidimicrobiia bacterium]